MFRKFASYYKPHMRLFITDLFCALLVAGCDLFYPQIAKNIINVYVPDHNLRLLLLSAAVLLGIYILKAGLDFVINYWGHVMGVRIQSDMRRDMFRHMQKLPFSYFDDNKTGTIMSRLINDLQAVSELAHHAPEDIFLASVLLVGSFALLIQVDVLLTCIVFALIPFMIFFSVKTRRMQSDAYRATRVETGEINANLETSIAGMRVSRAYVAAENENRKFERANERLKKANSRAYRAMGIFHFGMGLFSDLLYLVVLVSGGLFFFMGRIDVGEFTSYLLYVGVLLKPVTIFVSMFEQIQSGMTGFERFYEVMQLSPEEEPEHPAKVDKLAGHITFEHVSFSYANGDSDEERSVIHDLSLDIKQGKTVALVGPSGGGKTTLCHLIPRFYELDQGRICIDGIDITQMNRGDLRRNIGMVAQDVFLFNGTVRDNIAFGDPDASDEAIMEAAKRANIHETIMSLEKQYDTDVGERGVRLSGGQKQRISIARVFLKNPPILILDEATSALDNATEMMIQRSLEDLGQGRTAVVVAHRLSTIRNADEIIVLTRDGIAERGTHESLIEKGGLYAGLYEYQFRT